MTRRTTQPRRLAATAALALLALLTAPAARADQCILDDLIVDASACIGFDGVCNSEVFGFDTLRLKENNLRIHFDDTSVINAFPRNDWRIVINDSANGGASYFAIEDATAGRHVFKVEAGAPSNSLYVDDGGRVGLGTATPSVELHVIDGDTPTLRLQQDGSSGFAPQAWDVAGNETNFFIRDVTNGSADLHVEEASAAEANRQLVRLTNNGNAILRMTDTSGDGEEWDFRHISGGACPAGQTCFLISLVGSGDQEVVVDENGDMTISGANYNTGSSRELKENFAATDGVEILRRLVDMPLTSWNTKKRPSQRHLGPIAEDWWATFGLGPGDDQVSLTDVGGVALAAIQGLHAELERRDRRIDELAAELAELQDLLEVSRR